MTEQPNYSNEASRYSAPENGSELSPEEPLSQPPPDNQEATETADYIPASTPHPSKFDTPVSPSTAPGTAATGPARLPIVHGYEILEVLGRGGMGIVYRARHRALDRVVALKMILAGDHSDIEELARFRLESLTLARLQHPNIVQIYDVGEQNGLPYFSMELIEGQSLHHSIQARPPGIQEVVALVKTLAEAIHAAHQRGIIHRDLKPGNILVPDRAFDKESADDPATASFPCEVKITDFGLAKQINEENELTQAGDLVGTPSYMAPEQASGKVEEIGTWTDIYSLGVILYRLLTGRVPFKGGDSYETLNMVRTEDPIPPGSVNKEIPRDLSAICLKCLEKNPRNRYGSALALAEDLGRWQRGESTLARPLPFVLRLWRKLKRYRLAVAGAIALLLVVVTTVAATIYLSDPERKREAARKEIEQQLEKGNSVKLIRASGSPQWHQVLFGLGRDATISPNDAVFTLQSFEHTLWALVPHHKARAYRFSVELRHNDGADRSPSEVGIFFSHSVLPTRKGDAQCYFHLFFSDHGSRAHSFPNPQKNGKKGCRILLRATVIIPDPDSYGFATHTLTFPGSKFYIPSGNKPGPWRKLSVEVTPQKVKCFWGNAKTGLEEVASITAAEMQSWAKDSLKRNDELIQSLDPKFDPWSPQSPLGIYAYMSTVSVRNALIEPLPLKP